jgi:hypothetical protein
MATVVNTIKITNNQINSDLNLGSQIINCSADLRRAVSRLSEITNLMLQMFSTTAVPPDYTMIEALLGLQPGQGIVIWGIITNANTQIAGDASVQKFINWIVPAA